MDIISLSKANRVMKQKAAYQKNEVGQGVESHYASLDARLDYLEGTGSVPNLTEVINILQQDAVMINVEFVGNDLKLKHIDLDHETYKKDYEKEGIYEKIFDLTSSYVTTELVAIAKAAAANQSAIVEYAESDNGVTYSGFSELLTTTQFKRFVHLRIKLVNNAVVTISYNYAALLEEAQRVKNNLLLTQSDYTMKKEIPWTEEGTLLNHKIPDKSDGWLRIDKINVLVK